MKNIEAMTPQEINMTMIRLKNEYHRRREEFSHMFATDWVEEWINELQSQGYTVVIKNPGIDQKLSISKYDFIKVERR